MANPSKLGIKKGAFKRSKEDPIGTIEKGIKLQRL